MAVAEHPDPAERFITAAALEHGDLVGLGATGGSGKAPQLTPLSGDATVWSASLPSTVRPDRPPNQAPVTAITSSGPATAPLDLTDFKRDLSELTDRLGQAQDCL